MSHRLQVLIPEEMEVRLDRAARRRRVSKGELVREGIELVLSGPLPSKGSIVAEMAKLNLPTADIDELLRINDQRYGPLPE